jgi:hypothetical protein
MFGALCGDRVTKNVTGEKNYFIRTIPLEEINKAPNNVGEKQNSVVWFSQC